MRFFIRLSYVGANYCGWQIQPNATSVQEVLEKSMSLTARQPISIVGQGRTDSGVHAIQSFAHFDIDRLPYPTDQWTYKLNALLPPDIAIHEIVPVKNNAHARFDALSRSYRYIICTQKSPFYKDRAWEIFRPLNMTAMKKAGAAIIGKHDFTSFSSAKSDLDNRICEVTQLEIIEKDEFIHVEITANRFVMNMVRTIVGTLAEIGLGKRNSDSIPELFTAQNREKAGENAPPYALYLTEVKYPSHIYEM